MVAAEFKWGILEWWWLFGQPKTLSLHLESWELVPNPIGHGRSTRTTPATVPDSTQVTDIDDAGAVIQQGFPLRIPYLTIFDTADPNAADITFSANELSGMASLIYESLT